MVLENFISLIDWLIYWLICEHDSQHKKYIMFYWMWQGRDWWFVDSWQFIVLGFNDTSTHEGHFVSSPREREKRDRRESRGDKRGTGKKEEQEWKWRNRRNKNIPPLPLPTTRIAGLAQL